MEIVGIYRKQVSHRLSHLSVYRSLPVVLAFISEGSLLPGLSGIFHTAKWTNEDIMMLVPNLREQ